MFKNLICFLGLLGATKEYRHCFLCVSYLEGLLFCGSTDGHVYLLKSSLEEVTSFNCHQSGVNSIALCCVTINADDYFLLATGGDDNTIHLKLLRSLNDNCVSVSSLTIKNSHSAQVTGLHLNKKDSFLFSMSSVSIDQRLIRYEIKIHADEKLSCEESCCALTSVPDVASMDVSNENHFMCGQGISHYRYVAK